MRMASEDQEKYIKALLMCALSGQDGGTAILILNRSGFSHAEIAEMVGLKSGAVQKRVERAKKAKKPMRTRK